MAIIGKCPQCPTGTKDALLIAGACTYHFKNPGEVIQAPEQAKVTYKPIRKESIKQAAKNREYTDLRKAFLKQRPSCEMNLPVCTKKATEVHHAAGRGKNLLEVETWVPGCHSCHEWVTNNSVAAIEMGLSLRRNSAVKK